MQGLFEKKNLSFYVWAKGIFFFFARFNASDPNLEFVGLEVIIKGVQHLPVPIAIPRQNGLLGLSVNLD